jgi:glyceraldehyde 3-phosphate dehydrogenase
LKYDSVHGTFGPEVSVKDGAIEIEGKTIRVTAERNPQVLPWQDVDVAMECTGFFTTRELASRHLENGSKRVLISAPGKQVDRTVVYGVNHQNLTADDIVVSNASCTTNCLAPVAKILHEEFGIVTGYMTTIHSYTGDQPTLDRPHKDLYRARAAAMSMIPTSTGAAAAISLVLPELTGRLEGSAVRVPTPNVSLVDLAVMIEKPATIEAVNAAMHAASTGPLAGILGYAPQPLVSSDFNHNPHSSNFAPAQTAVTAHGMVRVMSWYDNEWGFSNRMLDTSRALAGTFKG